MVFGRLLGTPPIDRGPEGAHGQVPPKPQGVVFHPDVDHEKAGEKTHWDLRDQYLDWAENWFRIADVRRRPADVQAAWRSPLRMRTAASSVDPA